MNKLVPLLLCTASLAVAQPVRFEAPTVKTSGCPTNAFLVTTNRPCTLLSLQAFNGTNQDVYLLLCLTNGTPANGFPAIAAPEMVVFSGLGAFHAFAAAGRPVPIIPGTNNLWVVPSLTPFKVTNCSDTIRLEVTYYGQPN